MVLKTHLYELKVYNEKVHEWGSQFNLQPQTTKTLTFGGIINKFESGIRLKYQGHISSIW